MKKLTLTAVLAMMLCLLLIFSGCANVNCDDEKMQDYYIEDMTMFVGETAQLPMAGNASVSLSKEGIVSVENGVIRALSAGTVKVSTRIECLEGEFDITVEDNSRAVTVSNGAGGTITGVENGSYPDGTVLDVTITADAYNFIPTLKVNGKDVKLSIGTPEYTASIKVEGDTTVSVTYFDYTLRGESSILSARRELVAAESTRMATTLFYYDTDLVYESATEVFDGYALTGGKVYAGIPYTSGNQSLSAFMQAVKSTDAEGVNYIDTSRFFSPRWGFLYGASCADMAYWAQSQVSDTIAYGYAQDMTEANGLYKVGDYSYVTTTNGDGHVILVDTYADVQANGEDAMYEAYALLQTGDACTHFYSDNPNTAETNDGGNHAIVVAGVVVTRFNDGSVDPYNSYILYDDLNGNYGRSYREGATNDSNGTPVYIDGQLVYTACRNDYKMTFASMYSNAYLPMTCKELLTPDDAVGDTVITDSEAGNLSFETLITGRLESNYYISHATMTITDSQGNTVQSATRFGSERDQRDASFGHGSLNMGYFAERHNFAWSSATSEVYALYKESDMINPTTLASGSYHCTVEVYVSNGDMVTVRDFDFTV